MTTAIVLTLLIYAAVHVRAIHDRPVTALWYDPVTRWHVGLSVWSFVCAAYLWRTYL